MQPDLFTPGAKRIEAQGLPAFQRHSDTSRAAAIEIHDSAATIRERVYEFIKGRGESGATDEEIQVALDLHGNTERPRRRELQKDLRIIDSASRRQTESGRKAVVWVAV